MKCVEKTSVQEIIETAAPDVRYHFGEFTKMMAEGSLVDPSGNKERDSQIAFFSGAGFLAPKVELAEVY